MLEASSREVEATWPMLRAQPDRSRVYTAQPDNRQLPTMRLQVIETGVLEPALASGDGTALVVIDIRLQLRPSAT